MALSNDPDARAAQLGLRRGGRSDVGNTFGLRHGGRSEVLLRDVEAEVRELQDALGDASPVRGRTATWTRPTWWRWSWRPVA